jgi:hypothetical protein
MQKVRGSNPLSSTGFSEPLFDCKRLIKSLTWSGAFFVFVAEDVIHDRRSAAECGTDHVPLDSLGYVGGLVAYRVADLLDWDAVAAYDRYCDVAAFVSVPVADVGLPGHLREAPVESVGRAEGAVLVAEDEVVGLPVLAGFAVLRVLPRLVCLECGDGAFRKGE